MPFRNLLLHVDDAGPADARIDAALSLAHEHGAHLSGLYCIAEFQVPGWTDWPGDLMEKQIAEDTQRADDALAKFAARAEAAGVSFDTHSVRVPATTIADEVARQSRYSDLAIMGQADPDDPPEGGRYLVEQVALTSGRPVLVIPYIGAPKRGEDVVFGRNVMVAWDGGREASRAIHDALPILERADRVEVISVNLGRAGRRDLKAAAAALSCHLARHAVDVDVQHVEVQDIDPGDLILSRLSDRGSDLLVMGAYGHSRVRELILGGVTRSVLAHMTVPVLLSH